MKEELINQIRKDVENLKVLLKDEEDTLRIIKKLEDDEKVQMYLNFRDLDRVDDNRYIRHVFSKYNIEIGTEKKDFNISDEELIRNIYFERYPWRISEEDTNGIYVYNGTYIDSIFKRGYAKPVKNILTPIRGLRTYKNIETGHRKRINIKDAATFESENTIIYPKNLNADESQIYNLFEEAQSDFYYYIYCMNQDEAVTKLIQKYK